MLTEDLLLTIAFSVFGMLLIFGLGFVFPSINPYEVIKWIIIVCAAVFAFALLKYLVVTWFMVRGEKPEKKGGKK
jgi:hypothetical protein